MSQQSSSSLPAPPGIAPDGTIYYPCYGGLCIERDEPDRPSVVDLTLATLGLLSEGTSLTPTGLVPVEVGEGAATLGEGARIGTALEARRLDLRSPGTKGPSGLNSTRRFLEKNWDKATFGNVWKSLDYHLNKHITLRGWNLSPVEYTQRALQAFCDKNAGLRSMMDRSGRPAIAVDSAFGRGLFTPQGRIIWFEPSY